MRLGGELDIAGVGYLRQLSSDVTGSRVGLDPAEPTFLDASCLSALLDARRELAARGDRLEPGNATGLVRRVFVLSQLPEEFD